MISASTRATLLPSGRATTAPAACIPSHSRAAAKSSRSSDWIICTAPRPMKCCVPCNAPSVTGRRKSSSRARLAAQRGHGVGMWRKRARSGLSRAMSAVAASPQRHAQRQLRPSTLPTRATASLPTVASAV